MGFITRMWGLVWLLIVFFSCSESNSYVDGIPVGEVKLQSNMPQNVSENMILELIEVNDSRCPVGVVCCSAGKVDLTFIVYLTNSSFERTVTFSPLKSVSSDTIENIIVYINDVSPYKYPDDELQLEDYRITVKAQKIQ